MSELFAAAIGSGGNDVPGVVQNGDNRAEVSVENGDLEHGADLITGQPMTVADLNGRHMGATITIRDGGATYTGSLRFVHHDKAMFKTTPQKVFLGIDYGDWKHSGHYVCETPIELNAGADS